MNWYKNKVIIGVLVSISLTSCAGTNVSSDWDCPKQKGYGCINIERADLLAIDQLKIRDNKRQEDESQQSLKPSAAVNTIRNIWFAPRKNDGSKP